MTGESQSYQDTGDLIDMSVKLLCMQAFSL